jgi:hypothetical protein
MRSFLSDVRFGLRGPREEPGFAAVAVGGTRALGSGATGRRHSASPTRRAGARSRSRAGDAHRALVGSKHPVKYPDRHSAPPTGTSATGANAALLRNLGDGLEASPVLGGSDERPTADQRPLWAHFRPASGARDRAAFLGRNFPRQRNDGVSPWGATRTVAMLFGDPLEDALRRRSFDSQAARSWSRGNPFEIVARGTGRRALFDRAGLLIPLVNQACPGVRARDRRRGRLARPCPSRRPGGEMDSIGARSRANIRRGTDFSVVVEPLHDSLLGAGGPRSSSCPARSSAPPNRVREHGGISSSHGEPPAAASSR